MQNQNTPKTVAAIIADSENLSGKIYIRYNPAIDTVSIDSTAEGLMFLSKFFEAQAHDLGNMAMTGSQCLSVINKANGLFTKESINQLQVHRV